MGMSPTQLKALGKLLRSARSDRGLTLGAVASASGVVESTIKRLEDGDFKRPDPEKLQRIAGALDLDVEDLFALAGYTPTKSLPNFGPYLRTKQNETLSAASRKKLERYFEQLRVEDAAKKHRGGRGSAR
jgi:transcriptional regulator with XRE-family HTH domain